MSDTSQPNRIIALINQKGGVGKTTSTANLGSALAAAGRQTLLIDLDPQAHLTQHLGVAPDQLDRTAYDLLTDGRFEAKEIIHRINDHLRLLPADVNLAGVEAELAPKMITGAAQRILKHKLAPILDSRLTPVDTDYPAPEFTLIDCPPSLGMLTINALTLAREIIVPMQTHFLALQGLSQLLETVQLIRQGFNPDLIVSGIILCMHEPQTLLTKEVTADLELFLEKARQQDVPWRTARLLYPPVRRNVKLAESPSFGKSIFDYEPQCHGAQDYRRLAESLINLHAIPPESDDAAVANNDRDIKDDSPSLTTSVTGD